jgi:hypothetical protein
MIRKDMKGIRKKELGNSSIPSLASAAGTWYNI